MYIESFHIDGFGIFSNVSCTGLGPGLSIFYGRNEAGKSTCLEFIRTMLTGYPDRKIQGPWEPLRGGHPGGTLMLHCEMEPHEIRLMRSPASLGGLRLTDANGAVLHSDTLEKIFGHVDRDAYRRVFGFSLYELEQWDKKSEESIRNALYGASFGPGLVSPKNARRELVNRMDKMFRARGSQQPLNKALSEIEKLTASIREWEQDCAGYDKLASELNGIRSQLDELQSEKLKLEEQRRSVERRLDQWKNWDQWRNLGMKIERLGSVPPQLPENALAQLGKLQDEYSSETRAVASAEARLAQMRERMDSIEIDSLLLDMLPELRRLSESRNSYRQAVGSLQLLKEKQEADFRVLADNLAQLGPGWDCDRIRATDRSLFGRDGMEKKATAMEEAKLAHQADLGALESANQDVQAVRENISASEEALATLPDVSAILSENERDELRANMTRLEENRKIAPGRERALDNAMQTFKRTLAGAHILGSDTDAESGQDVLDQMIAHQEEVTALADDIMTKIQEQEDASAALAQAENEISVTRGRINEIKARQRNAGGQTRAKLESRAAALRSLRALSARIESAEAHKNELDERIRQEGEPTTIRNWTVIFFAILFLSASAGIMAAHWFLDLHELAITSGIVIPINLWAAYAALVCGLILLASGLSGNLPERKRRKQEFERLLASNETATFQLNDLALQAQQLCEATGADSYDPISLDAMEMLLEREKEQLFHEEREQDEMETLSAELDMEVAKIAELQKSHQKKENEIQQLRKRWHNLLKGLNVGNVPSPESINTVFERINSAKLAEMNVLNAREELDALWEDLHLLESAITSMPQIKERLEAAEGGLSLEEVVKQALDKCREADQTRDIRERLERDLAIGKSNLERALARQQAAADKRNESLKRFEQARDEWIGATDALGLSGKLDPETVREAYRFMAGALGAEDELKKTQRNLEQAEREIAAFEGPIERLSKTCESEPSRSSDGSVDWLNLQEELLARAEASQRALERRQELSQSVDNLKQEIAALEARRQISKSQLEEFLASAGAKDANELEQFAHIRESRRSLMERRDELETSLTNVARGMPLREFLDSFAETDEESQERILRETRDAILEIDEKVKKLDKEDAILEDRRQKLEESVQPGILRQRKALLMADAQRMASEWSSLALADALLREARLIFEKERQPEIIRAASGIFARITDGKWKGISLNLEDSSLVVLSGENEPVAPEALSRGAQEQAYLSLRLAYINSHAAAFESLPVIMDEVLVNFDPDRARRCAETFASMAGSANQQILYFTCQPHIVEMLKECAENPAVFNVENGTIRAT